MLIFDTLPISTPLSRTGAPTRSPSALSKNENRVIRREKKPPVPDIRNKSSASTMLAKIYREAHAKLRPFELLLARQMISSDRNLRYLWWRSEQPYSRPAPSQHHNKNKARPMPVVGAGLGSSSRASR